MESTSKLSCQTIMQKGKREAAALIYTEIINKGTSEHLNLLLDKILNPKNRIDDNENIEWCKWLIAGGRTPAEFATIIKGYDNHAKCGLVWIPHVVAYRCRTCGISPCMSICRDCFKKGDHSTHDFNMFLSQAGGACDCGDASVMKVEGFCSDHGVHTTIEKNTVPDNLLLIAKALMPRLLLRLLHHFRDNENTQAFYGQPAKVCDSYCSMLMELNNMGDVLRRVMTNTLIDPKLYKELVEPPFENSEYGAFLMASKINYENAIKSFPSPEPPDEYKHLAALGKNLEHTSLIEEFIFWTFKFEFPQNIVCFLLNMLPDQDYKEYLTRTFVMHYSRIPSVLEMSKDPDTLSNRVVHMSVQLFSNESLALKMVEELSLLHVMIISLKLMMSKNLIQNTLHEPEKNFHYVIDCAKRVMKEHCYWPLVSDFNNVLSHESVALVFLRDDNLIDMWFQFLSMLQGMNVNIRETGSHVEYEPSSYYAAFSCELEASAYPMWSILSHLKDMTHAHLAKKIMSYCVNYLQEWLEAIYFYQPKLEKREMMRSSFHFPLHRYLASFISQAVRCMGMSLKDILPSSYTLTLLMMHPLRVQSFFYEILSGVWIRNGLQIKGQAMTYIQANFCNSMVDMDLFFLQICSTQLPPQIFLSNCIDVFGITNWLGVSSVQHEMEQDSMLEGLLTFLATLVTSRTNLGNSEPKQCIIEISALLATNDKTHSQLLELMPERSGNAHTRNFEKFLKELSIFRRPPVGSENLDQGLFIPVSDLWEKYYDPLHVLLRAVHRRDFQNSMDRFGAYVKQENKMPKSGNLWPPFRIPEPVGFSYGDPVCILHSRVLHGAIFGIFYRAVNSHNVSEHMLALAVFLLELAVESEGDNLPIQMNSVIVERGRSSSNNLHQNDTDQSSDILNCYPSDCLRENLRYIVHKVSLTSPEPQVSPANYSTSTFDSDLEWEVFLSDVLPIPAAAVSEIPVTSTSMEVALPQDLSITREQSLVLHTADDQNDDIMMDDSILHPQLAPAQTPPSPPILLLQTLPLTVATPITTVPTATTTLSSSSSSSLPSNENNEQAVAQYLPNRDVNTNATGSNGGGSESGMELVIRNNVRIGDTLVRGHIGGGGGGGGVSGSSRNSNEMFSPPTNTNTNTMLLPFQRVQPVEVRSLEIVPSNNFNRRRLHSHVTSSKSKSSSGAVKYNSEMFVINESIISLLLKLHSQLSGTLDSFSLDSTESCSNKNEVSDEDDNEMEIDENQAGPSTMPTMAKSKPQPNISQSRIGDGPYFIGNLLKKIANFDGKCLENINEIRRKIWPNQREKQAEQNAREIREKEERSKRAKERQQKLMEEFAKKQKKFMEMAAQGGSDCCDIDLEDDNEGEYAEKPREKEYVCIICNNTSPSTESNPIGLVVLVESSGVIGHRRKTGEKMMLPLCEDDFQKPNRHIRLTTEFNRRTELLSSAFGDESWYLSNNSAYDSGVHVQSCGHHVHLTCHDSYLQSLYTSQRHQNLNVERGEFSCPVCRQLSNSVLPLSPQLDRPTPVVRIPSPPFADLVNELTTLIKENERPPTSTKLSEAMGRAMEDMTNSTYRKHDRVLPTFRSLFLFVTSIARTNLEAEIIQRGGSLFSNNLIRYKPKRDCIVPLLQILSVHVRVLVEWPLWCSWAALCGLPSNDTTPVPSHCKETIPNLLADPISLMLKYILLAPLHLDQVYFTCIVKVLYNLLYFQTVLQLCTTLTEHECNEIIEKCSNESSHLLNIGASMAFVLNHMDRCRHLRNGSAMCEDNQSSQINMNSMEQQLQKLCLPFLRVASLLRHHLYNEELPHVASPQVEFVRLVYYLELVTESMDWDSFNAGKALCFIAGTEIQLPRQWCIQLNEVKSQTENIREIVMNQHVSWQQPRLLGLPKEYERLFTYYHEKTCIKCKTVPKESSICLLCGEIVCLKQRCCIEDACCEAVRHSIRCGGGTGVFLVVTSTYIIVIRGRRACLWGSLYLDDFDEEDRDLKRGKPLYLNEDRFNLLESQWLSHRFAHTKHTWVFHRDSL